jgi:hypothetical protein
MLMQDQVALYLVARGFVSSETIIAGDLVVEAVPRHNHNFKIRSQQGPSYLLKQGTESGGVGTVAYEARVYDLLSTHADHDGLRNVLPRSYGYDPDQRILLLELYENAQDIREYQARRNRFPKVAATLMGEALGILHALECPDDLYAGLSHQPPAILSIHRPGLDLLQGLSMGNRQVVKMVQTYPVFAAALERLRQGWEPSRLIHGDIRWDNWLVTRRAAKGPPAAVRIVDWEFAAVGDPCWDAGSIFAEYLAYWLLAVPSASDVPPERLVEISPIRLEQLQPAMRAFWRAYERRLQLTPATSAIWLLRSGQFAAARLVERAAEQMHRTNQFTGQIVFLLQVAMNILQRPQDAVVQLLGIG